MANGIIAGTSTIENENIITPKFDAFIYDFIIGQNGHNLNLSLSGSTLVANGVVIAKGVRAFFNNATLTNIGNNDYIYVDLTMNHNLETADSATIYNSTTEQTESTTDISTAVGTYRIKVAKLDNGVLTITNKIKYPYRAMNSEKTTTVKANGVLEDGVTAADQQFSDNSSKVANTKFVQGAIGKQTGAITFNSDFGISTISYNVVRKAAGLVSFNVDVPIPQPSGASSAPVIRKGLRVNDKIGDVTPNLGLSNALYFIASYKGIQGTSTNGTLQVIELRLENNEITVSKIIYQVDSPSGGDGRLIIKNPANNPIN